MTLISVLRVTLQVNLNSVQFNDHIHGGSTRNDDLFHVDGARHDFAHIDDVENTTNVRHTQ